jgi:hypothetical protein
MSTVSSSLLVVYDIVSELITTYFTFTNFGLSVRRVQSMMIYSRLSYYYLDFFLSKIS